MRLKTPLIAITAVTMMALAACGGSDGDGNNNNSDKPSEGVGSGGDTGNGQDPKAEGPVTIDGATEGGIVNVKASGMGTVEAGGIMTVKGSMVAIN